MKKEKYKLNISTERKMYLEYLVNKNRHLFSNNKEFINSTIFEESITQEDLEYIVHAIYIPQEELTKDINKFFSKKLNNRDELEFISYLTNKYLNTLFNIEKIIKTNNKEAYKIVLERIKELNEIKKYKKAQEKSKKKIKLH